MTLNIVNFTLDYNVSLHSIGGVNVCYVIDRDRLNFCIISRSERLSQVFRSHWTV